MKRNLFWLGLFLLFVFLGCEDRDIASVEDDVEDEFVNEIVTGKLEAFFTIDTVLWHSLQNDESFINMCEEFDIMEELLMTQRDSASQALFQQRWFERLQQEIVESGVENIAAYILATKHANKEKSRLNHWWGKCYYYDYLGNVVCDTYEHWQDAWEAWAYNEQLASGALGDKFSPTIYRQAYVDYLRKYSGAAFGMQYVGFLDSQTSGALSFIPEMLMYRPLDEIVRAIQSLGVPNDMICYFIWSWEELNIEFYNSYVWLYAHDESIGGGNVPGGGGGSSMSEVLIDVINDSDLRAEERIKCVFDRLTQRSNTFEELIEQFRGENPLIHLSYAVSYELADSVNAEVLPVVDNYTLRIVLNGNVLPNMPPLITASAIVHETIHAHIFRQLLNVQEEWGRANLTEVEFNRLQDALDEQNYPSLYYFYNKFRGHAHAQHDFMSVYYVPMIRDILYEIAPEQDQTICDALAWIGLNELEYPNGKSVPTSGWLALGEEKQKEYYRIVEEYIRNGERGCL